MAPRQPTSGLWQAFYISPIEVSLSASPDVVAEIVETLRAYSFRHDLTGAIACDGEFFVHVIEGAERNIARLLRIIRMDRRHGDMRILLRTRIHARYFAEWSLAYVPDAPLGDRVRGFFEPGANDARAVRLFVRDLYTYISRVT